MLKLFIRRDYELRFLKMRLLEEIKVYLYRYDKEWKYIIFFKMISGINCLSFFIFLFIFVKYVIIYNRFFYYGIKNNLLEYY